MRLLTFSTLLLSAVLSAGCDSEAESAKDSNAEKAPETIKMSRGKEVYQNNCIACHVSEGKPTIAPPIFAVKNHVMAKYPVREDFVKRVSEWIKAPNADDVLMRGAVGKFGLMPPLAHISDEDAKAVAEFLFDSDMALPDWYAKHYEEEHGEAPKAH